MEKIELVKYSELIETVGEPGKRSDMVLAPFPFPLYLMGNKSQVCRNICGNKYIVPGVIDAFNEILDIYGIDFIRKNNLDWYGGCYEDRKSRGSGRLSVHSWGMAVDYLPQLGKFNSPSLIPYHIVRAFTNRGFNWGGDWNNPDGMHFSGVAE